MNLPQFNSKKEELAYIVANKAAIMEVRKGAQKNADAWSTPVEKVEELVGKASSSASDTPDSIARTIVANTYYWLDSHGDVHIPGIFGKAISEKKPLHLHDHIRQVAAKVGRPQRAYEQAINWRELGVNKDGQTTALFVDSKIEREMNPAIFRAYKNGEIDQHSVGMVYVRMALAVNDPEYKEEYAEWLKVFPHIGNQEEAEKAGYFFSQYEAKLPEFSCVLEGSNTLTPMLPAKSTPPAPSQDTPAAPRPLSGISWN